MNIALILAGGTGSRMGLGYNKVFAELGEQTVLAHTVEKFERCSSIDRIIVVAGNAEAGTDESDTTLVEEIVRKAAFKKVDTVVAGGPTRMLSAEAGLLAANPHDEDIVLIQDGGRPFCPSSLIEELIQEAKAHGASICGAPPKDTIQQINSEGFATKTFDRSLLIAIFTPVAAKWSLMKEARKRAKENAYLNKPGFEDSALLQEMGVPVKVVESDYRNIKITTPVDLLLAEQILKSN